MKKALKIFVIIAALAIIGIVSVILFNTLSVSSKQLKAESWNQPEVPAVVDSILSEAIQIQTISYDEAGKTDTNQLLYLHRLLDECFPMVHQKLKKSVINQFSLLYTWEGSNPGLAPIILMAHLDVVPVEPGTEKNWTFPPFSGKIDNGFIWGRGSLDDKVSVIGILHAVEMLLAEDFVPERSILLAFGHDEEIAGGQGARQIAELLHSKNVKAEFILDEGLVITDGIVPGMKKPVALIGISEKGYMTTKLSVKMNGGHSAMPAKTNALTTLATAVSTIQKQPFRMEITKPVEEFMDFLAPELPFVLKMAFTNRWLFKSIIFSEYDKLNSGRANLQTTFSTTIFRSGVKENVVPSEAEAFINFRILPNKTSDQVLAEVKAKINSPEILIQKTGMVTEPSPAVNANSNIFKTIQRTVARTFPEAVVAPALVVVTTDSRHFTKISPNIFKFLPVKFKADDLSRIHGSNERISIENFHNAILFYFDLMQNTASGKNMNHETPIE